MDPLPLLGLAAAAIVVGTLVGATGIGGFLIIPALILCADLPVRTAMGTALLASAANGALGAWLFHRRGNVDGRIALPLAAGSVLFALFGAWLNRWLPVPLIAGALGIVMILGSVAALFGKASRAAPQGLPPARGWRGASLAAIGCLAGLVAGLTGAGGPLVSVPLMAMLAYPTLAAVGAGQVLQLVASAFAAIPFAQAGHLALDAALVVVPAQLLGIRLGVGLAHVVDARIASRAVAAMGAVAGVLIVVMALGQSR